DRGPPRPWPAIGHRPLGVSGRRGLPARLHAFAAHCCPGSSVTAAVEQSFVLRGLAFRIQRWGASGLPVMALHGWLDNSESFAPLAACLPGVQLAAPDLAG